MRCFLLGNLNIFKPNSTVRNYETLPSLLALIFATGHSVENKRIFGAGGYIQAGNIHEAGGLMIKYTFDPEWALDGILSFDGIATPSMGAWCIICMTFLSSPKESSLWLLVVVLVLLAGTREMLSSWSGAGVSSRIWGPTDWYYFAFRSYLSTQLHRWPKQLEYSFKTRCSLLFLLVVIVTFLTKPRSRAFLWPHRIVMLIICLQMF